MPDAITDKPFRWIGSRLCLDFNNTVDWIELEPQAGELLDSYPRLVEWSEEAGQLAARERDRLLDGARRDPPGAGRALARAHAVRSTIHGIFLPIAHQQHPAGEQLDELNRLLAEAPPQIRPVSREPRFDWSWAGAATDLTRVLWPIVWSAGRLLTSPDLELVKTCANEECGWLFVDSSRKHNRKWCEMGVCGNRAKARRFYERKKRRLG